MSGRLPPTLGRPGRMISAALAVLILGAGLCLLGGDGSGLAGHATGPELCLGWLIVTLTATLIALVEVHLLSLAPVPSAYTVWLRRLVPPPRASGIR